MSTANEHEERKESGRSRIHQVGTWAGRERIGPCLSEPERRGTESVGRSDVLNCSGQTPGYTSFIQIPVSSMVNYGGTAVEPMPFVLYHCCNVN